MKRRGFSIWELLLFLGMMSIVGVISQRLFVSSFRTMQAARAADTAETRFDHAMLRMRQDAWAARQISASDTSAQFIESDGATIAWRIDSNGTFVRSDGKSELTWPDVSSRARFSGGGAVLALSLPEGFSKASSELKLVSQFQLGGGAP